MLVGLTNGGDMVGSDVNRKFSTFHNEIVPSLEPVNWNSLFRAFLQAFGPTGTGYTHVSHWVSMFSHSQNRFYLFSLGQGRAFLVASLGQGIRVLPNAVQVQVKGLRSQLHIPIKINIIESTLPTNQPPPPPHPGICVFCMRTWDIKRSCAPTIFSYPQQRKFSGVSRSL